MVLALALKDPAEFEDLLRAALGDHFERLFTRTYRGARVAPILDPRQRSCLALDPKGRAVLLANTLLALRRALDRSGASPQPGAAAVPARSAVFARAGRWAESHDLAVCVDVPHIVKRLHPVLTILQWLGVVKGVPELPPAESLSELVPVYGGLSVQKEGLRLVLEHPFSLSPIWEVLAILQGAPADRRPPRRPGSKVPIAVRWRPGSEVLYADGQQIRLGGQPGEDRQGRSADGRFRARLGPEGLLELTDLTGHRTAVRSPQGSWIHSFDGKRMKVSPDGNVELRLSEGRLIRGDGVGTRKGKAPPTHRWQLGVGLDRNVKGKLLVKVVYPGSPAEKAGLRPGDEILAVGSRRRPTEGEVVEELKGKADGEKMRISVRRGREIKEFHAVSGAWE
jgi:hypothetical protein